MLLHPVTRSIILSVLRNPGTRTPSMQGDPALRYAFRLLSYRGRSEREMADRLRRKGFDEATLRRVIEHLRSAGLLDDRKLASSLKRYAGESRYLSVLGTKRLLVERGVPPDVIQEAITDIDESGIAARLVEKKIAAWRKHSSPDRPGQLTPEEIRKLYGFLARRGYSPEVIRKSLQQYKS